jgi:hypothetical protein
VNTDPMLHDVGGTNARKYLRASTTKCCIDCLNGRFEVTDYDIKDLKKTPQGYKCKRHYKSWVEQHRKNSPRLDLITGKGTAK